MAFSGKKKAALLKAKRATARAAASPSVEAPPHGPPRPPRPGGGGGRPQLKTVLAREDEAAVQAGRADATRPLELSPTAQHGTLLVWPPSVEPPISMPLRPAWSYADAPAALEAREAAAFAAWDASLQTTHGVALARYERNLDVWRQLWRTLEVSDALLLVVDARFPLLSFPAPLHDEAQARGIPCLCVLNKADLLPPGVAEAWAAYLQARFPNLRAVLPFRADPGAAPKGFKGPGVRRSGANRWRVGRDAASAAVRADVEALFAAVRALPLPPSDDGGGGGTFGDFWDDAGGGGGGGGGAGAAGVLLSETASSRDHLPPSSSAAASSRRAGGGGGNDDGGEEEGDEAKAAAAALLARSEEWAAAATAAAAAASHPSAAPAAAAAAASAAAAATSSGAGASPPPRRRYATLGVVGEPNQGKSAVINRMFGAPVVQASPTPGCTKHLQTLHLRPRVRLADCPGLVFPKTYVPPGLQLLCGNTPIAQAREPFATIRYLAEAGVHPPLQKAYGLQLSAASEHACTTPGEWSPFAICEALAVRRSFLTRGGRPDVFRAANRILRDALAGKNIRIAFVPPRAAPVLWQQARRDAGYSIPPALLAETAEAEEAAGGEEEEEEEEEEGGGGGGAAAGSGDSEEEGEGVEDDLPRRASTAVNPFAALGEEG